MKAIKLISSLFLLASPFLIGWGIFSFLSPGSFWEGLVTLILVLIICVPEGIIAWGIGLIILDN